MNTSRTTCQTIKKETVLIPIEYIRQANQIFIERDKLEKEVLVLRKIKSIDAKIVNANDSIINKLEKQIVDLNSIIEVNKKLHNLEVNQLNAKYRKAKRSNYTIAGCSAIFITILILI